MLEIRGAARAMSPISLEAGGDVLEGAPAAGEQPEPAFAGQRSDAARRCGRGRRYRVPSAGGLLDGDVHTGAGAVLAGSARWASDGGPVKGGQILQK